MTSTDHRSTGRPPNPVPAFRWLVRRWGGPREVYVSVLLGGALCGTFLANVWFWQYRTSIAARAVLDLGLAVPESIGAVCSTVRVMADCQWLILALPLALWVAIRVAFPRPSR